MLLFSFAELKLVAVGSGLLIQTLNKLQKKIIFLIWEKMFVKNHEGNSSNVIKMYAHNTPMVF
jgi:hypothetical protein